MPETPSIPVNGLHDLCLVHGASDGDNPRHITLSTSSKCRGRWSRGLRCRSTDRELVVNNNEKMRSGRKRRKEEELRRVRSTP